MSWSEAWTGIAVMAVSTYLVRVIPLLIFRKKLNNRFIQAFLFYVPYAVLAAMTFPDIFYSTPTLPSMVCGLAAALILAWNGKGLLLVSLGAAAASLICMLAM